jgi:hypothetical protein
MNVRCRTYNCTAAAPRRRALAVLAGSILELFARGEQVPKFGIDIIRLSSAHLQSLGVAYLIA